MFSSASRFASSSVIRSGLRTAARGIRQPDRARARRAGRRAFRHHRGSRADQTDAVVSGGVHPVEQRQRLRHVRVDADRDLERAVADRCVRRHDALPLGGRLDGGRGRCRCLLHDARIPSVVAGHHVSIAEPAMSAGSGPSLARATASYNLRSASPSAPDVRGSRPVRTQSANSRSSRLNASS